MLSVNSQAQYPVALLCLIEVLRCALLLQETGLEAVPTPLVAHELLVLTTTTTTGHTDLDAGLAEDVRELLVVCRREQAATLQVASIFIAVVITILAGFLLCWCAAAGRRVQKASQADLRELAGYRELAAQPASPFGFRAVPVATAVSEASLQVALVEPRSQLITPSSLRRKRQEA
jgi:hypothetical protein